jgi:hypothetical protein
MVVSGTKGAAVRGATEVATASGTVVRRDGVEVVRETEGPVVGDDDGTVGDVGTVGNVGTVGTVGTVGAGTGLVVAGGDVGPETALVVGGPDSAGAPSARTWTPSTRARTLVVVERRAFASVAGRFSSWMPAAGTVGIAGPAGLRTGVELCGCTGAMAASASWITTAPAMTIPTTSPRTTFMAVE